MEVDNLEMARFHFTDNLVDKGVQILAVRRTRPRKLGYWIKTSHGLYLLSFKREYYHNFGKHFPEFDIGGWGQIGNKLMIKRANRKRAYIVMVMPDGKIYLVPGTIWWNVWKAMSGREVPHAPGEIPLPLSEFHNFDEWFQDMFGPDGLYMMD